MSRRPRERPKKRKNVIDVRGAKHVAKPQYQYRFQEITAEKGKFIERKNSESKTERKTDVGTAQELFGAICISFSSNKIVLVIIGSFFRF